LRKCYYKNLKILRDSTGIKSTNQQQPGSSATQVAIGSLEQTPVYEIVDSWLEIPWAEWVEDSKISEDELRALATAYGFPAQGMGYATWRWCVTHSKDAIHAVYPSYMMDKSQHPYEGESFIDSDGECIGQGLMVRLSNIVANK